MGSRDDRENRSRQFEQIRRQKLHSVALSTELCATNKNTVRVVHGAVEKSAEEGYLQKTWLRSDTSVMFILTSALDYSQVTSIENCESSQQIISLA